MRATFSRVAPLLCAVLLAVPSGLLAQSADVAPGIRIRVVDALSAHTEGTLTELRGDSLVVRTSYGGQERLVTVSMSSLRRLQVSQGTPSRLSSALQRGGQGAVVGGIAGALMFTSIDLIAGGGCDPRRDDLCIETEFWALVGLYIGSSQGALWGAGYGFFFPQERWRTLPIRNAPRLTLDSAHGGVRLGLSVPLP